MEVSLEYLGLLDRRDGRRDRANKGDRVRVDREVVIECVVEEGKEVWDLRVDLKETPEGELDRLSGLTISHCARDDGGRAHSAVRRCLPVHGLLMSPSALGRSEVVLIEYSFVRVGVIAVLGAGSTVEIHVRNTSVLRGDTR